MAKGVTDKVRDYNGLTSMPRATTSDSTWEEFRREMPAAVEWAYFDHAAVAPIPRPTADAMTRWADEAAEFGGAIWPKWKSVRESLRSQAAQFVGAELDEMALVRSTTEGINLVAEGFPWQPGDNVVTLADEFPSNLYPWMNQGRRGVETRRVATDDGRVDLNRLADACDNRTRIVSISWIGYASGWRNDLTSVAEIAHRHGALFFLDAIQGLGAFPLDVRRTPIDFFAADGHKWLLGPEGAGLFYIRREHLERIHPIGVGWNSVAQASDFSHIELKFKDSAARFEGGSSNMVGFTGLASSIELLGRLDGAAIGRRIVAMTDLACSRLADAGARIASHRENPDRSSGIVLFEWPGRDPQSVRRQLLDRKIVVSCRSGKLRISPHAYCNDSDIDRLVEGLRACT
jgi:cysteine desulfurase / selenocysteine lyase